MAIARLNPYLFFAGDAGTAIARYERALDATTLDLQRYADIPGEQFPPEFGQRVIHARLQVGGGEIMISDSPPSSPRTDGANVAICLTYDDVEVMARHFDALAEGGQVTTALHDTFWGARHGSLLDAHGVRWLFDCPLPQPGAA